MHMIRGKEVVADADLGACRIGLRSTLSPSQRRLSSVVCRCVSSQSCHLYISPGLINYDIQASYTFPVGVTTLWWYAAPSTASKRSSEDEGLPEIFAENNGTRLNSAKFRL